VRNAKVSRNRLSALGTLLLHVFRNRSKAYGSEPYAWTMRLPAGVCVMSETASLSATTAGFGAPSGSGQEPIDDACRSCARRRAKMRSALAVREGAETADRNSHSFNKKKQRAKTAHSLLGLPHVIVVGA